MDVTADMIITRRGTVLPLDQRRREALAEYARQAADFAGMPAQTWVRKTWDLKDYEAKDLLKCNSSEQIWERILKSNHPEHGGWKVAFPVMAAVIGMTAEQFLGDERKKHVELARRNGALVTDLRAGLGLRHHIAGEPAADANRERRSFNRRMGEGRD